MKLVGQVLLAMGACLLILAGLVEVFTGIGDHSKLTLAGGIACVVILGLTDRDF